MTSYKVVNPPKTIIIVGPTGFIFDFMAVKLSKM